MATLANRLRPPSLSREDRFRLVSLATSILFLHLLGFGLLLLPSLTGKGFALGLGLTAYGFGLRHAFDADHLTAIDNTTRKLLGEGHRSFGVGFFFALGHSTVVFLMILVLSLLVRSSAAQNVLQSFGNYAGPLISGGFLLFLAGINLFILRDLIRLSRNPVLPVGLGGKPQIRGLLAQILAPLINSIRQSWQMYPVGFLFGLGFDTATEVGLLALAYQSTGTVPLSTVLALPILFAAGMSLMDTANGIFMAFAYHWTATEYHSRLLYNLVLTSLSILAAALVGFAELLGLFVRLLHLSGGIWDILGQVNLNNIGILLLALFAISWLSFLILWRRNTSQPS